MEVNDPIISIITVTLNNYRGVVKTAQSILNQTQSKAVKWIIIDGKSKDQTLAFLKKTIRACDKLVSESDSGLYDAMNKGLALADTPYIWFLNAGDTIHDAHTVEDVLPELMKHDVMCGETMLVDPDGKEIGKRSEVTTRKLPASIEMKHLLGGMIVNHQSVIVKREICPEYNLQYRIAADYDWICNVLKQDPKVITTNRCLSNFETGGISSKRIKKSWIERFKIMITHFGITKAVIAHVFILKRALLHH